MSNLPGGFIGGTEDAGLAEDPGSPGQSQENQPLDAEMGLEAIYPKPRLSSPGPDHKIYPYLLKGVRVENQIMSGVPISPISGWFVVLFIWL